jgi:hypothetical protein
MTTYRSIANTETDPQAPVTSALMKAFQNNVLAVAEGDATAPVNQACWHPYDMIVANDGASGVFYNDTVTASIATPTMVAGYDYAFRGVGLSHNNGASQSFLINGVTPGGGVLSNTVTFSFYFEIISPVKTDLTKIAQNGVFRRSDGSNTVFADAALFTNFASSLTTFNFTWSAGNFDAGQIYMYRRRNYMS